jgi:hypothetical protein
VFLDGGFGDNIITKKLKVQLGMSKPKLAPYNMCIANETITKPLGLIKDLKIIVHGIPYVVIFVVIHSIVLDSNYFILLGHPWLKDVKVSHNWATTLSLYKESAQF